MNEETYGALKRIVGEVQDKRDHACIIKDCLLNDEIGGNDIDLVKSWIEETAREHEESKDCICVEDRLDYHCKAKIHNW